MLFASDGPPFSDQARNALEKDTIEVATVFAEWLGSHVLTLRITFDGNTYEQGDSPNAVPTVYKGGALQLTDTQQTLGHLRVVDTKGFDTTDPNAITWSEDSNGAVVTLQPSSDGTSCEVSAVAPGTATVSVTDGTITGIGAVVVVGGAAQTFEIGFDAPVDQPPPAPPAAQPKSDAGWDQ